MVSEELLWVLWQNLLFSVEDLTTTAGEQIIIQRNGTLNKHAGPDFSLAHLIIGSMEWRGDIEIHVRSSDWNRHKHTQDPAYESVILHVVYEADENIIRADGTMIPVLELKQRIAENHLQSYLYLMESKASLPCESLFPEVKPIVVEQMKQRVLVERLERKTDECYILLKDQPDWKKAAARFIFKAFGTGLNDALFERIAANIDFNKLDRLSYAPKSVEALFFGMAGMLDIPHQDPYAAQLLKEFTYLRRIVSVEPVVEYSEWKFLRTRPSNFPTMRLAQLAALFSDAGWFAAFVSIRNVQQAKQFFSKSVSPYWQIHYRFGVPSITAAKHVGYTFINTFLINACVPYAALEARYYKHEEKWEEVFQFIDSLKAEDNTVTRMWTSLGMKMETGFDSQGALELYKMYCTHKKCLSCSIGYSILRNESVPAALK
ncbi:MAG: DUF2851 family protein [Cytophaga sp.]|uniref:DUF2851 family protein n=1 Tax=Cytophaga sp. TaxID=29535 RepID=UPI003F818E50